ncbi:MASE1 domain-containing protein [Streptomyces sp. NPDC058989]|uniref:MASE1 domain-containing protein n=1 Tax=Streptomyces sp. NPDC058989 TaxID=3346686 RepID=UPI00368F252A
MRLRTAVWRQRVTVAQILATAGIYYGSAQLGLLQELVRGQVTPLWPPTGIALTALLLFGLRMWPGIALGAFLVNVSLGPSLLVVLAIVAGNTIGPVLSYRLLRRVGFHTELDRLRDALALVVLGALTGMLVSSTVGSGVLALSGALPASGFWPTWAVWWTGDAMGVLVITPVLLLLSTARWPLARRVPLLRWAEAVLLVGCTFTVTVLAVSSSMNLLFLVSPCLIWAAFRFERAGAAPCALLVSTVAIVAAVQGSGPFAPHDLFTNMVTLQAFNGITALTALLLAAVITERRTTQRQIMQVVVQLSEAVSQLDSEPSAEQWPPPRRRKPGDDGG